MTTAVKERPILFSGPMVRAILAGQKTQTRRVVDLSKGWDVGPNYAGECWPVRKVKNELVRMRCPYGQVGERLWVRETHYVERAGYQDGSDRFILYKATDDHAPVSKWTPSIHMPRFASRINQEIVRVSVERLQDITNLDCNAEGITPIGKGIAMPDGSFAQAGRYESKASTVRQLFSGVWESINGPGSWDLNPWVWVVQFKKLSP